MRRLSLLIALVVLAACIAVAAALIPQSQARSLVSGGEARTYHLHVPAGLDGPAPLLIGLHGAYSNGLAFEGSTGLDRQADRLRFRAVYPDGVDGFWNAGFCCGRLRVDDVRFISDLVSRLVESGEADPARIYVTGMSNGGFMAYLLGCRLADRITAIAPVAATMGAGVACEPARPVPVLHIHGSADLVVGLDGGARFPVVDNLPVADALATWRRLDGCPARPASAGRAGVDILRWSPCQQGSEVVFYLIAGLGHSWPALQPALNLRLSTGVDASATIADFFGTHPRR